MTEKHTFRGFSEETVRYLNALKKHNTKTWFDRNRKVYETHVLQPSKDFVVAMGERLKSISPDIAAVPKVNKSLFRINRDTRFSPDKSPYKTHIGIFFWEGTRPKMECSGFYVHVEPPDVMLGVGIYMFAKPQIETYRKAVVHPDSGDDLSRLLKKMAEKGAFELGGKHYKRIPSGYDAGHPNAEFLLHSGLYIGKTETIPEEFHTDKFIEYCMDRFSVFAPLHEWLVSVRIGSY